MKKPPESAQKSQQEKFIETARELDCEENEEQFEKTLKKIVPVSPKEKPNR